MKHKYSISILVAIILVLIGIKFINDMCNDNRLYRNYNIVMFGNSITAEGNWADLLGRSDVLNKGYSGYTSSHLNMLVEKGVISHKPKICFIMVGINDIRIGDPIHRIKTNYISILNMLLENDITPIVQSILYGVNNPDSKILIDSMNTFLCDYCNDHKIKYMDLNNVLCNSNGLNPENSTDGLHLSQRAYELWAIELKLILIRIETD